MIRKYLLSWEGAFWVEGRISVNDPKVPVVMGRQHGKGVQEMHKGSYGREFLCFLILELINWSYNI